ncbi:MAG: hypothetical protein ACR2HV_04685, partial [Acidimicrobiales bacterium]
MGHIRGEELAPAEIPVDQLCEKMSIEPRDLGSPENYLLFAGVHGRSGGGLRDLVGTFATEQEGRQAFIRLRVQHPSVPGWAELAAIDGFGRIRQVCWFGLRRDLLVPSPASSADVVAIGNDRRGLRRLIGVAGERRTDDVASF